MTLLTKALKYEPKFKNLTLKGLFSLTNKVIDYSDIECLQNSGTEDEYFSIDMFDINCKELVIMVDDENENE